MVANLLSGALAGVFATWLMDVATTAVQSLQPPQHAERERAAWPHGRPSVVNLVDRIAERLGLELDEQSRSTARWSRPHALGAIPGAIYAALRDRVPGRAVGRGLLFGAFLWAVDDELLNARLGLSGPPTAYPLMTHVRRLIGHVVLGRGTEIGIRILAGIGGGAGQARLVMS